MNQVFEEVVNKFTRIDYVASAAGVALKHIGGIVNEETKDWKRVLNINLDGAFYVVRAAAKIMLKQEPILSAIVGRPLQRGSIVIFISTKGVIATAMSAAYDTSNMLLSGLRRLRRRIMRKMACILMLFVRGTLLHR